MRIGTKTVLFGVHQFLLHPLILALAWWRLFGWGTVTDYYVGPVSLRSIRLWIVFFVHDLGYIGKPNLDGPEGEQHPLMGARLMLRLGGSSWYNFVKYHSRFLAKTEGARFSLLCVADKQAIIEYPIWLYLILGNLSGEIKEYMMLAEERGNYGANSRGSRLRGPGKFRYQMQWLQDVQTYMVKWVAEHKDGRDDLWTKTHGRVDEFGPGGAGGYENRVAKTKSGVYE